MPGLDSKVGRLVQEGEAIRAAGKLSFDKEHLRGLGVIHDRRGENVAALRVQRIRESAQRPALPGERNLLVSHLEGVLPRIHGEIPGKRPREKPVRGGNLLDQYLLGFFHRLAGRRSHECPIVGRSGDPVIERVLEPVEQPRGVAQSGHFSRDILPDGFLLLLDGELLLHARQGLPLGRHQGVDDFLGVVLIGDARDGQV